MWKGSLERHPQVMCKNMLVAGRVIRQAHPPTIMTIDRDHPPDCTHLSKLRCATGQLGQPLLPPCRARFLTPTTAAAATAAYLNRLSGRADRRGVCGSSRGHPPWLRLFTPPKRVCPTLLAQVQRFGLKSGTFQPSPGVLFGLSPGVLGQVQVFWAKSMPSYASPSRYVCYRCLVPWRQ